jgi:hypothetical protein
MHYDILLILLYTAFANIHATGEGTVIVKCEFPEGVVFNKTRDGAKYSLQHENTQFGRG